MLIPNIQNKTFLFPTDTILGLGCSIFDMQSIQKIYQIKKRRIDKNFILLVNSVQMLQEIVEVPEIAWQLMDVSTKPITIVYDNPINIPETLISNDNTLAIRLTTNKFCNTLINKLKTPIISTSVNISGTPTPLILTDISKDIIKEIDYIFPECYNFIPQYSASSIIKISKNNSIKIIRP